MAKFKFLCYFETESESPFIEASSLGLTPISLLTRSEHLSPSLQKWLPVMSDEKNEAVMRKEICDLLNGDNLPVPTEKEINSILPAYLTIFVNRSNHSVSLYRVDDSKGNGDFEGVSEMSEIGTLVHQDSDALKDTLAQIYNVACEGNQSSIDGLMTHFYNNGV
jgi:hypothetical protein